MAPTVSKTTLQAGEIITRDDYSWGTTIPAEVTVTYAYRSTTSTYNDTDHNNKATFNKFTAVEIAATELALDLWEDVANIHFQRIGSGTDTKSAATYSDNATMLFASYSNSKDGAAAYASYPIAMDKSAASSEGDFWNNRAASGQSNPQVFNYAFQTFLHEIGHAIGLEHPGNYNAGAKTTITYDKNADYIEDTRQYSVMSYFDASNSGAAHGGLLGATPLLHDIAAVQRIYGANMDTRTGDDTYGFNSTFTASDPRSQIYSLSPTKLVNQVYAIWDAGGNDTLDYSGFSNAATLNLSENSFSSTGTLKNNIAIALGVTIENAFGGGGNDLLLGNSADNHLKGNEKADRLVGFSGADTLDGGAGDDQLEGDDDADTLNGGDGVDWAIYTSSAGVTVDLWDGTGIGGQAHGDKLSSIENIEGSFEGDFFYGSAWNNVFKGNNGLDFVSYSHFGIGVTISLANAAAQTVTALDKDILISIERLEGTNANDKLTGTEGQNILRGLGGDDTLDGLGNNGGKDQLEGGAGNDLYVIGVSDISLVEFSGEGDKDRVFSHVSFTLQDEIEDLDLWSVAISGIGNNRWNIINGNVNNNVIEGRDGNDTLRGGAGLDTIRGENHDDLINGGAGVDKMFGGFGEDTISWEGASGGVTATLAEDDLLEGSKLSIATGGADANKDEFQGFERMIGTDFADKLTGNQWHNELTGGLGNDILTGNDGDDIFYVRPGQGSGDVFDGGNGLDLIWIQGDGDMILENFQDHNIEVWAGNKGAVLGTAKTNILNFDGVTYANISFIDGGKGNDLIVGTDAADDLRGGDNDDVLLGGKGNDKLDGGSGKDLVGGMDGDDTILVSGDSSGDGFDGGADNDTLRVVGNSPLILSGFSTTGNSIEFIDANNVVLNGTKGDNTFDFAGNLQIFNLFESINGLDGKDKLYGSALGEKLDGGNGDDVLEGLNGEDILIGGAGNDQILGGGDNDLIVVQIDYAEDDVIDGGSGFDTIVVLTLAPTTLKNFDAAAADIEAWSGNFNNLQGTDAKNVFDLSGLQKVSAINAIDGGFGNDLIIGSPFDDNILGGFGDDDLRGGDGNDKIEGGGGKDKLDGGDDNDTLNGSRDADEINGGSGIDTITFTGTSVGVSVTLGLSGNKGVGKLGDAEGDTYLSVENAIGTRGSDTIIGNEKNNRLEGGEDGKDFLDGGDGDDQLAGGKGVDTVIGGAGDDFIEVSGVEHLTDIMDPGETGETFGDSIRIVGSGPVTFIGFDAAARGFERWLGNDQGVLGTGGADVFDFSTLTTVANLGFIDGGTGNDKLIGADLSVFGEELRGGFGDDQLFGLGGPDKLDGGFGNDKLFGGDGGDRLTGGPGDDIMDGGSGPNTFVITFTDAVKDTFIGGANTDAIEVSGSAKTNLTLVSFDSFTSSIERWHGSGQAVVGDAKANVLNFGNISFLVDFDSKSTVGAIAYIDGAAGNDTITGTQKNDDLRGGAGEDTLDGAAGNDVLNGGADYDLVHGGDGDDVFQITGIEAKFDDLFGDAGTDTVQVLGTTAVTLHHFSTVDYSLENWIGNSKGVVGFANDFLDFSNLKTITNFGPIDTGAGNDTIIGGIGNDSIKTGTGDDTVHYGLGFGIDTVQDFKFGGTDDQIDLTRITYIHNLDDLKAKLFSNIDAPLVTFRFSDTDFLTLNGGKWASLTKDDFIFAGDGPPPGPSKLDVVSLDVTETAPFDTKYTGSVHPQLSADGNTIVFVAQSGFTTSHIFVRDLASGTTKLVNHSDAGADNVANASAFEPSISADGRFIAYVSDATDIAGGAGGVFVYDIVTGTNSLVSIADGGPNDGNAVSSTYLNPVISGDGRFIVYSTFGDMTGTDSNNGLDIFLYDRVDGHVENITEGVPNNGMPSIDPAISADGRFVVFSSFQKFIAADTNTDQDIYLWDRVGKTMTLIGDTGSDSAQDPSISASGQFIAFETTAALVAGDKNNTTDIYLYDQLSETYRLVSTPDGVKSGDEASSLAEISGDGAYVLFRSVAGDLVAGDTNGRTDIFLYNVDDGSVTRISVDAKDGELDEGSTSTTGASISGNGSAVAFATIEKLLLDDGNSVNDIYVSRLLDDTPEPIFGSYLADNITGTVENNLIVAYDGDDIISVAGGAYEILGGEGNDDIEGGSGQDIVIGGPGSDVLKGKGGADVYVYTDVSDSPGPLPGGAVDRIFFGAGDLIDLRAIDAIEGGADDPFNFSASTNEGAIAIEDEGTENIDGVDYFHSLVLASTDADANAEFALHVYSLTGLLTPGDVLV